ncbi:MAG: alkaline phosphatase D [Kiritimatiellia bacterium]|jgi:alkaline phosphatase D
MAGPSRRDVLKGLSLSALGAACGHGGETSVPATRTPWPTSSWAGAGSLNQTRFPLGVQAGDPLPTRVMLWTRYRGEAALEVIVALWVGGLWQEIDPIECSPDVEGFVHVDVTELPVDTVLSYQFVDAEGDASVVAQARTAVGPGATGTVRFAIGSCNHIKNSPLPALSRAAAGGELDFALHLGDTIYADGAYSAADYRGWWQRYLVMQGYQDLFAVTAGIYTWDDHEILNNVDPEGIDPEQLANSNAAFREALPVRTDAPDRLWRKLAWGDIAEVFVLDCRTERRRSRGEYISTEQLEWLKSGLLASTSTWKVVASSVPFTRFYGPMAAHVVTVDNWLGHGEGRQRQEIIDFIDEHDIDGVLFVGGDIHMNLLARVDPDGRGSRIFELIAGPGGASPNPLGPLYAPSEQFPYVDAVRNMYIVTLSSSGHAWVEVVGEDREWMTGSFDDRGNLGHLEFSLSKHE